MKPNRSDLIEQVNWLLARMTRGQILRVLSYANRIYVSEDQNNELQRPSERLNHLGQEKPYPKTKGPQNG